jgi:hypothetical protein
MKRLLAVFGLLFGLATLSHAGTPQETFYSGQPSLSGTTILTSSASTTDLASLTLTIATPTVLNSGGGSYNGRNCFTKFVIQMSTGAIFAVADNGTTVMTVYGAGLGTSGSNTLSLPEDHLGPLCTASGDKTVFTITGGSTASPTPQAIDVEGYTTYGGTNNSGPMY